MVSVESAGLMSGGPELKENIWEAARPTLEAWTGMKLKPSSLYGIHVDRLPLVSSCIINVDQDVDEPWELEIYDRNDRAVNITMKPGDMVLYESGSLIHGRPFALKGRFYANIFIHFEPTGESLKGEESNDIDDFYPPYILPGSPEISNWEKQNPTGWQKYSPSAAEISTPEGHAAAAKGDIQVLQELVTKNILALHAIDENGWQPLHEAVRAGHIEAVQLLVEHGADVNAITNHGLGVSPYHIALTSLSESHQVSIFLSRVGAVDIGPEL